MKYLFSIFVLFLVLVPPIVAQDEESEESPRQREKPGLAGGGFGVIPTWFFVKTSTLNGSLNGATLPQLPTSGMFLFGEGAYLYQGFIKNLRIGGFGAGGSMQAQQSLGGILKSTTLKISYVGGAIEYVIPFGNFHIAPGILLGGGSATLSLLKAPDKSVDWSDIVPQFGDATQSGSVRHDLANGFFTYQPMLSLEYLPIPFLSLRLTGGYFGIVGNSWTIDDQFSVVNTPEMKFGNPYIQFGLFLGAFL